MPLYLIPFANAVLKELLFHNLVRIGSIVILEGLIPQMA